MAEAKLAAPRQRAGLVARPRIGEALDAGVGAALTLVAAPVGYGKTTAVRAWCAGQPAALAWVTLDVGDNDPVRLWSYVATAVDRIRGGLGRAALRRLSLTGGAIEDAVDELMNGIAAFRDDVIVVLDDLQSVTDGDSLASIGHAIEHLPGNARLIVLTRADPELRLARLRARGDLVELRASELAFTMREAYELIVERGEVPIGPEEVQTLCRRTEGWPAALYLALLWLRGVGDPQRAVRDFGGDHRFVAEYLNHEVLDSLDDDRRWFLLRASVLGQFTPALCEGVLSRDDATALLRELEQTNLFVTSLEHGGWFRVHPLFAEFAQFRLASLQPGAAEEIHRRAAVWLRERNLVVESVEHAASAGDAQLVAEILAEHHLSLIRNGGARTLLRWTQTLPDDQVLEHPELAVAAATAAGILGQRGIELRRFLRLASRAQQETPERFGPYAQAVVGMVRAATVDGGVGTAVLEGRRAVELAEAGADDVLLAALAGYARALYFAGDLDGAWAAASRAVEHPEAERRAPGHAFARSTLALVAADRGWLGPARAHAEAARSIIGRIRSGRSWLGANASVALGGVLAAEGDFAAAERELVYAERFFRDEVATVHQAWVLALLARARYRRGRLDEAETALRSSREALDALPDSGQVAALVDEIGRELDQANARAGSGEVLTPPSEAELAVLRLLASDLTTREIGRELFVSANTVRSHTRAIYRKLGVTSRADAVARATALGLLGQAQSPM
jgi:LuxR family maltose regulon positive regulatory protein